MYNYREQLSNATSAEEIREIMRAQQQEIDMFAAEGYATPQDLLANQAFPMDAIEKAEELGIPLIENVNDDRFRVTDLGIGTEGEYVDYLTSQGWLPEVDGRGWETHRVEDGQIAISYNQKDMDFGDYLGAAIPSLMVAVAVPAAATALAELIPALTVPQATAAVQGAVSVGQGGDFENVLVDSLAAYGIADLPNIIAEAEWLDPVLEKLDPVFEGIESGILEPASDLYGDALNAIGKIGADLGIEGDIGDILQYTIDQGGEFAEKVGAVLPPGYSVLDMYDTYRDINHNEFEPEIPVIQDQPGGLPDAPATYSESTLNNALENNPSALEDYWANNPEALEQAIQSNPEAFEDEYVDVNEDPELLGGLILGGGGADQDDRLVWNPSSGNYEIPYEYEPGENTNGSTGSGLGGELNPNEPEVSPGLILGGGTASQDDRLVWDPSTSRYVMPGTEGQTGGGSTGGGNGEGSGDGSGDGDGDGGSGGSGGSTGGGTGQATVDEFDPVWTELFKYTTLTPARKAQLAPHIDYLRSIKR